MSSSKKLVATSITLAFAWIVACSSASDPAGGGTGLRDCPKLPNRDLAQNPDGTVLCRTPHSATDTTLLICKDGSWQPVLDCGDSTQTTEGGFVHSCKCADSATGDVAYCYYINNCGPSVPRGGAGGTPDAGGGLDSTSGADTASVLDSSKACVDITTAPTAITVVAGSGNPTPPSGGAVADGTYMATAQKIYGAPVSPNTKFGGIIKIAAPTIELVYGGSATPSFSGKGTFTAAPPTVNVTFSCSTTGPGSTSFQYSANGSLLDVTTQGSGFTAVTTYTKQ
jgi:hypothetical protein